MTPEDTASLLRAELEQAVAEVAGRWAAQVRITGLSVTVSMSPAASEAPTRVVAAARLTGAADAAGLARRGLRGGRVWSRDPPAFGPTIR